jgi:hypothetical protein
VVEMEKVVPQLVSDGEVVTERRLER